MSEQSYSLLRRADLQNVLEGIEGIYSAASEDSWIQETWRAIRHVAEGEGAFFLSASLTDGNIWGRVDSADLDRDFQSQSAEGLAAHIMSHPCMQLGGEDRPAALVTDYVSMREFHETAFYREVLKPIGIRSHAVLGVGLTADGRLLGFSAERQSNYFSQREKAVLDLLCRHIRIAHANLAVKMELEAVLRRHSAESELSHRGCILADRAGNVALSERVGSRLLSSYFGGEYELGAALPEEVRKWIARLSALRGGWEPVAWPEYVREGAAGRLTIRGVPAARNCLLLELRHSAGGLPAIRNSELTPRELEVLHWIGQGYTNPQIAAQLGTSLGTVKSQVSNLLKKLGAKNRTAAAKIAERLFGG